MTVRTLRAAAAGCGCALAVALCLVQALVAQTPNAPQNPSRTTSQTGNPQSAGGTASTSYKTPWGDPDLQGVWNFGTVTPLERPKEFENKAFFTPEEAGEFEKVAIERSNADDRSGRGTDADVSRAYNEFWWEHGTKVQADRRTSLIVDPPDGKVPPLTVEARQQAAEARAEAQRRTEAASYADMSLRDRCLIYRPLPAIPTSNNNNFEIVQSPGWVVIVQEEIHEARRIPLDGRPHVPENVRQWMGDSRGHWEGNTLVVETTNFNDEAPFRGSGSRRHLIERWTRTAEDHIDYEFTVTDPTTWTRPWTAAITYWRNDDGMFEYACHEGNYALEHILSIARGLEKAAGAARTGSR